MGWLGQSQTHVTSLVYIPSWKTMEAFVRQENDQPARKIQIKCLIGA